MRSEQAILLGSTLATFLSCYAIFKLSTRFFSDQVDSTSGSWKNLLSDIDTATNIHAMDPNAILAFLVGLVASVGVLLYLNAGSECSVVGRQPGCSSLKTHFLDAFFSTEPKPCLDPKTWQQYRLLSKQEISPNTALYRFRLPKANGILGLPIGQHISLQANIDGKDVMRSYTPTSSDDDRGFFDLIIKVC